jgi:hypothetical protein
MALSPLSKPEDRVVIVSPTIQPSRTYEFDFDRGEFTGSYVDNESAIRQFIRKALVTSRRRHLIYDNGYGSELESIIGLDFTDEMKDSEIPRIIREALIYDERILSVDNIEMAKLPGDDGLYVSFSVVTSDGQTITEGVTV